VHADLRRLPALPWRTRIASRCRSRSLSFRASASLMRSPARQSTMIRPCSRSSAARSRGAFLGSARCYECFSRVTRASVGIGGPQSVPTHSARQGRSMRVPNWRLRGSQDGVTESSPSTRSLARDLPAPRRTMLDSRALHGACRSRHVRVGKGKQDTPGSAIERRLRRLPSFYAWSGSPVGAVVAAFMHAPS
jgi:hypothetical protein